MRVLVLRRQSYGAAKNILDALPAALLDEGIEVVVDDADEWIPNSTGFAADKETSKAVKKAAQGFDLVHAWGYRAAWACSEAFYVRTPWLYTAYDMPKTTHSDLIDRLNASHRGVCSSRSVKEALDAADTLNLEIVVPGVPPPPSPDDPDMTQADARERLGFREDALLVTALGNFQPERGFDALLSAFPIVRQMVPRARLFLAGFGKEPTGSHQEGVDLRGPLASVWPAICAADLVVVPSHRAGFSLVGAETMLAGIPVMYRNEGGLKDMAEDGINAFFFDQDQDIADKIAEALQSELTREAIARAGQLRAQSRFKFDRFARGMAHVYQEVAGA